MARAVWNGQVIAESDQTEMVEGNHYFPPQSIRKELFTETSTRTTCGWKGVAHYYTIEAGGDQNVDAAWFYPDPKSQAENIRGYVAFWKGVAVEASDQDLSRSNPEGEGQCEI